MEIDGGCHCGAVRYRAEINPEQVSICHCTDCQMLTGSPFRVTVLTSRDRIEMIGDTPKLYAKAGDNGGIRRQYFCGTCGSPVVTSGVGHEAEQWGIRWGSIRQRAMLSPKRQIWCRSAPDWIHELKDVPSHPMD